MRTVISRLALPYPVETPTGRAGELFMTTIRFLRVHSIFLLFLSLRSIVRYFPRVKTLKSGVKTKWQSICPHDNPYPSEP